MYSFSAGFAYEIGKIVRVFFMNIMCFSLFAAMCAELGFFFIRADTLKVLLF